MSEPVTPTPWVVREYATSTFLYPAGDPDSPPIALVSLPEDAAFVARAVSCHADLLAACEEAVTLLAEMEPVMFDGKDHVPAMLRAAIAKARGMS